MTLGCILTIAGNCKTNKEAFIIKNIIVSILFLALLVGCSKIQPELKGSYQSEGDVNGYVIQLAIQPDDKSFVEYIDNREVDRGSYEKVESGKYIMTSDKQNFTISLNDDNSFNIILKKLNGGAPITMVNITDVPGYFSTRFDDVKEYKALLDE